MARVSIRIMTLSLALVWCASVAGQTHGGQPHGRFRETPKQSSAGARPVTGAPLYRDTWYDSMLRQLNPDHRNWGDWIEERRQSFVDASARNPYFKYSLMSTVLLLMALGAWAKALCDASRTKYTFGEKLGEVLRHDGYSREAAREAIQRYNEHIEKCNRVIEAQEAGLPAVGVGNTEVDRLRTELEGARTECDAVTRERDKLQAELKQTSATVADLSLRLSSSTGKGNLNSPEAAKGTDTSTTELMQHINRLQQQLYAEREKNKRLKGG